MKHNITLTYCYSGRETFRYISDNDSNQEDDPFQPSVAKYHGEKLRRSNPGRWLRQ